MSVEYKSIIFVGVKIEDFPLSQVSDDLIDRLTEDYFLTSNTWCGGKEFYGNIVSPGVDAGDVIELSLFDFSKIYEGERERFQREMKQLFRVDVPLDKIGVFYMTMVY